MAGRAQEEKNSINVGKIERWFSALGGGGLVLYGLKRRSGPGLALALLGGVLIHRGATGHCYLYQAIGANTARRIPERATKGVVEVEKRITVALPPKRSIHSGRTSRASPGFSTPSNRFGQRPTVAHFGWQAPTPGDNWSGRLD